MQSMVRVIFMIRTREIVNTHLYLNIQVSVVFAIATKLFQTTIADCQLEIRKFSDTETNIS